MSLYLIVGIDLASAFFTIIYSVLHYSNQAMANLRNVLEANRSKRDGVILGLHSEAKKKLDHVAASIRENILESGVGASKLRSEEITHYIDVIEEAYYLLEDARDIRDSFKVSSRALAKIRFNALLLLIVFLVASLTLLSASGQLLESLIGLWVIVLLIALPVSGSKIFNSYRTYKGISDLLSDHEVGIHDESR